MKILFASPYFHPTIGGVENYVEQIARQFVAKGHDVHIVTSGKGPNFEIWNGMTIHRLRTWFTLSNTPVNPLWTYQIRQLINQIHPDVINAHAPVPTIALASTAAAGDTPVVVTYHAGSMKKGKVTVDLLIRAYESVLLPWMLSRATSIICASDFVRESFLQSWAKKSVSVTPGVDTSTFAPSQKKKVRNQLVFVGNFSDPRKGLGILLEAMQSLPQLTLRVVGYGKPTPQDRVEYLGELRGAALTEEIARSQALVLPSTTDAEAFGTVLIEGMACGVAVIGTRVGGVSSVISDGKDGYLISPGNASALTNAINRLFETPDRVTDFGRAGRRKAVDKYDWKPLADRTEDILKHAIANPRVSAQEVRHG